MIVPQIPHLENKNNNKIYNRFVLIIQCICPEYSKSYGDVSFYYYYYYFAFYDLI